MVSFLEFETRSTIFRPLVVLYALPFLVLLPLLTSPISLWYHAQREGAGYFQALAFTRLGIDSFFTLTPVESLSSLHLHSLLSAPLIELGYVEGGRLISLLAAIAAVILVGRIGYELSGRETALLAPAILLVHPLFLTHSYAFMPETLSIALTAGCLLATIRYVARDDTRYFYAAIVCFSLGVANHMWEATILLPVVVYLLLEERRREAVVFGIAGLLSVGVVRTIALQQPQPFSLIESFGLLGAGPLFLQPDWWIGELSPHPFGIAFTLTLPASIIGMFWYGWIWVKKRHAVDGLIASWLASGISIPFLIPGGFPYHRYYLWALLAPLSIAVALLLQRHSVPLLAATSQDVLPENRISIINAFVVVLILLSTLYGGVFHLGVGSSSAGIETRSETAATIDGIPASEAIDAGQQLQRMGVRSNDTLVFVGNWRTDGIFWGNLGRVLVYSDTIVTGNKIQDMERIHAVENGAIPGDCDYTIRKLEGQIAVSECN